MAGGSQYIVSSVLSLDELNKETSNQTISVSEAVEEQTADMDQIAERSKSLANLAEELRFAVDCSGSMFYRNHAAFQLHRNTI